ncbi:MAG: glycosyltransferase, partial [Gammaproteobacteria bacterium]
LGRPIVATDVCGVAELIEDGISGLIVRPEDPDNLAAALAALLDDPARAAAMGTRIRAVVEERFSWRDKCSEYLSLVRAT